MVTSRSIKMRFQQVRSCSSALPLSLLWVGAISLSLALLIVRAHCTCPPDDPHCDKNNIRSQTPTRQPARGLGTGSQWTKRLLGPLPDSDELGLPISDVSEYTELTSQPFSDSQPLLAGHWCHSHNECDTSSNLSCENFPTTTSTTSSVPTRSVSRVQLRSALLSASEATVCSRVHCNSTCANLTAEPIHCPPDSYIDERDSDDQNCCIQTCKCLPDKCSKQNKENCSYGFDITSRGSSRKPGNCCDEIRCVYAHESTSSSSSSPAQSRHCSHEGVNYTHNQTWTTPDCTRCTCQDGVSLCDKANNCPLAMGCKTAEDISLEPHQCCSLCKGCMYDHQYRAHLSSWMEDLNCKNCTCLDGRVKCHTTMCRPVSCSANQVQTRKSGECCLQCECPLQCPFGLKKDPFNNDLDLCECADGVTISSEVPSPTTASPTDRSTDRSTKCAPNEANCDPSNGARSTPQDEPLGMGIGSWLIGAVLILLLVTLSLYFGVRHFCLRDNHTASGGTVQSKYQYEAVNRQEPALISSTVGGSATEKQQPVNSSRNPVGGQGQVMANGHAVKPQNDLSAAATSTTNQPTATATTLDLKEETSQV